MVQFFSSRQASRR